MILSTFSSPPSSTSRCNDDVDIGDCYCSPHHVLGYYYCSPQHRQAQRLNNTAVTCIIALEENDGQRKRKGGGQPKQQIMNQHEQAISILEKALRICEREEDQEHDYAYDVCSCDDCSIDGCIVFSSEKDSSEHDDHHADNDKFDIAANEDNDNDGSTIYPHPLYVQEGHNMGSTVLHTIIQFNLALAYHLQCLCWMEATTNNSENEIKNEKSESDIITININIHKALHFYDLACDDNLSTTRSIRFDTIICNNLCHIYRYQEDQIEKEEDEQHYYQQQQQVTQHQQQSSTTVTDNEDEDNDNDDDDDTDGISFSNADMADDRLEIDYYRQEEKEQGKYERNNTSPPSLPVSIERSLWSLLPDFQ